MALPTNIVAGQTGHIDHHNELHGVASQKPVVTEHLRYVTTVGSDSNDGRSWGTAYATIAKAVADAAVNESMLIRIGYGNFTSGQINIVDRHVTIEGLGIGSKIRCTAAVDGLVQFNASTQSTVSSGLRNLNIDSANVGITGLKLIHTTLGEHTMFNLQNVFITGFKTAFHVDSPCKFTAINSSFEWGWGGTSVGIENEGGYGVLLGCWFESVDKGLGLSGDSNIVAIDPKFASVTTKVTKTTVLGSTPHYHEMMGIGFLWDGDISANRSTTTGSARAMFQTAGLDKWGVGMRGDAGANFLIFDEVNETTRFVIDPAITTKTYAASNVTADRTFNANATTLDEVADVLGTLISDLRDFGLIA